ncbi:MAG: hypothetical protein KDC53_07205 [Saprospiraceae bacterium]|nr:hypothetical protein [Saprospiraceae bacterium]
MQYTPSLRFRIYGLIAASFIMQMMAAQSFGGFRPSIHWAQINTDTARIIFPGHLLPEAERVANMVHYLRKHQVDIIGDKALKVDILLNDQTIISNGFVSIAPWKSLFVTTPLQDNYELTALPWLDLLTLHEYRHVVQLSSARRGIVKWLYYLFGQESWAGAANLSLPGWFTEGDAVWAETVQSQQGRGRIPAFLSGYRALKLGDTKYNYSKARNGSLKDFVPDHYRLGYLLVKYGHEQYGDRFWKDVMLDAAAYKGIFYPFARAMQKYGKLKPAQMYNTMWQDLSTNVNTADPETAGSNRVVPKIVQRNFTDDQYPHLVNDSILVFFERSYDRIGRFKKVNLRTGEGNTIVTKGLSIDPYFSGNGRFLSWTEYSTNPRWTEDDYSDIFLFDVDSGQKKRISKRKKFFSPQPSPDGSKIICISKGSGAETTLCLIDIASGMVVKEIARLGWVFTYPQFSTTTTQVITAVRNNHGEMAIVQVALETEAIREIVPFRNRIVGVPEIHDSLIFYSSSTEGLENIFSTNISTGNTYRYTNEPNGAFQVTAGKDSVYFVTMTDKGHIIKSVSIAARKRSADNSFEWVAEKNLLDSIPHKNYPESKYHPVSKSINIHTWGLDVEDPEIIARVLSNNVLNNVEIAAGVKYNYDQQNYRPFARASIATWYPTIDLEASRVNRSAIVENAQRNWTETNLFGGLSVDWHLFSGSYIRTLTPSIGINNIILNGDLDFTITSLATQLTFQQQQTKARKNIFTHSGQYLQVRFSNSLDQYKAEQIQIRSGLAVRGIGVNHSLILHADLKSDIDDAEYQFSNGFNHRGYGVISAPEVMRLSADYHFPIFYPDIGFAGLVYFYRVRMNPFFEYSRISDENGIQTFQSVGTELVFDMNMVNEVPLSMGIRYSYPLDKTYSPRFEVFIPIYRF